MCLFVCVVYMTAYLYKDMRVPLCMEVFQLQRESVCINKYLCVCDCKYVCLCTNACFYSSRLI